MKKIVGFSFVVFHVFIMGIFLVLSSAAHASEDDIGEESSFEEQSSYVKFLQAVEGGYDRRGELQKVASYRALGASELIASPGYAYWTGGASAALGKFVGLLGRKVSYVDVLENTIVRFLPSKLQGPCSSFLRQCSETLMECSLYKNPESHIGQFVTGALGVYVTHKFLNQGADT